MLTMVNTMLIRLDYECEQNQCPTMIKSNNTSTMAKSSVIVMDNNDNNNVYSHDSNVHPMMVMANQYDIWMAHNPAPVQYN